MEERYPFIRFVIDAAPFLAGAVALIVLLGGTLSACRNGGVGGFIGFLLVVGLAAVVYVAVMVRVESLRVLLDIENNTREQLVELRHSQRTPSGEQTA